MIGTQEDIENWQRLRARATAELAMRRHPLSRPEPFIRGHELPLKIETFDGLCLPYGYIGL